MFVHVCWNAEVMDKEKKLGKVFYKTVYKHGFEVKSSKTLGFKDVSVLLIFLLVFLGQIFRKRVSIFYGIRQILFHE